MKMEGNCKKCLVRWHEYSDSVAVAVQTLRYDEELLDVTLACEGQTIRAHKLVLAASSQYFRQVLKDFPCEHPTIVVAGVRWRDLAALLQFMYYGQVLVEEEAVASLLSAASSLSVIGLSYVTAALTHIKVSDPPLSHDATCENETGPSSPLPLEADVQGLDEPDLQPSPRASRKLGDEEAAIHMQPSFKRLKGGLVHEEDLKDPDGLEPQVCIENGRRLDEDRESSSGGGSTLQLANGGATSPTPPPDETDPLEGDLDSDLGPAPLAPNHPAVLAISYASLLAAGGGATGRAGSLPSPNAGLGNCPGASPGGLSLPLWVPPPSNSASPPPSPPAQGGFMHSAGMSQQDLQATLEHYQRKLAFHEPRPCPTCRRMYRDAATLRTHIAIMHSEGKELFGCTCGALFRTKYDMYRHKKNGHR